MKIKDPVTQEEREETEAEKATRVKAEEEAKDKDPEHWKKQARTWETRAKENTEKAKKFDELQAAGQSEAEKTAAEKQRGDKAEAELRRVRVAMRKGLTETQARRLVGDTEEALEADADDLLKTFTPAKGDEEQQGAGGRQHDPARLRSGAQPAGKGEEMDVKKVVDEALSRPF